MAEELVQESVLNNSLIGILNSFAVKWANGNIELGGEPSLQKYQIVKTSPPQLFVADTMADDEFSDEEEQLQTPKEPYQGPDYSEDNIVVDSGWIFVGAPYRKEVSPDDSLGTWQSTGFRTVNGVLQNHPQNHHYANIVTIQGPNGHVSLADLEGQNVQKLFPNPADLINGIYNEIGLQY